LKRRSIYDRSGEVWCFEKKLFLVVETVMSKDRRSMDHVCFALEAGGFRRLLEKKVKRWEWMPAFYGRVGQSADAG
jgi:hypothetical protein